MALERISGPDVEPVSLAEAKAYLRVDDEGGVEDALIGMLIRSARGMVEQRTGLALITQTWDYWINRPPLEYGRSNEPWWNGTRVGSFLQVHPVARHLILPLAPVQAITGIYSYSDTGTETVYNASNYRLDVGSTPGRISLVGSATWPTSMRASQGLKVRFIAGYGDTADLVPETLTQAVLKLVAVYYENRDTSPDDAWKAVKELIAGHRRLAV